MPFLDQPDAAIAKAFRDTLGAGSAHVRYLMDSGPPEGWPELMVLNEGVANFESRMVRLTVRLPSEEADMADLVERRRISGPLQDIGETFFAGGAHYYLADGKLQHFGGERADPPDPMDPTWLLEAVASGRLYEARQLDSAGDPDGQRVDHYEAAIRLSQAMGATLSRCRPKPARSARNLVRMHAWVDRSGLVERMSWTLAKTRRAFIGAPDHDDVIWRVTDLSEFGVGADITLPATSRRPGLIPRSVR